MQVKENKKKRIHAIKSQYRMKKKEEEQTAKQVIAVHSWTTCAFALIGRRIIFPCSMLLQSSWKSFDKSIGKKKVWLQVVVCLIVGAASDRAVRCWLPAPSRKE